MDSIHIKKFLEKIATGEIDLDEGVTEFKKIYNSPLGYAHVDNHRAIRCGFPEVIYCPGKTVEQIKGIALEISKRNDLLLATRISEEAAGELLAIFPDGVYNEMARTFSYVQGKEKEKIGKVAIVTAGTSDIPVAEEARVTAELMGANTETVYDVGVAGIHRLLCHIDLLKKAKVMVVVAGMEGALASVVGGLVDKPVIAVPTSIGYGVSLNGISALLSMLNSCASNVSVVNIDNGFSAGTIAALINRLGT